MNNELAERWGGFVAVFVHTPDEWSVLFENPRYIRVVRPIEESKTIEELNGAIHRVSDDDCNALTSTFLDTLRYAFARRAKDGVFLSDLRWLCCPLALLFDAGHKPTIQFCLDRWENVSDDEEARFQIHITSAVKDLIALKNLNSLLLLIELLGPRKQSCIHLIMTLLHEAVRYEFEPLLEELKPYLRRFTQSELQLDVVLRTALRRASKSTIVKLLQLSDFSEHFSVPLVQRVLDDEIYQLVVENRWRVTVDALCQHNAKWATALLSAARRLAIGRLG